MQPCIALRLKFAIVCTALLLSCIVAPAQQPEQQATAPIEASPVDVPTAPVEVDGNVLFNVRGVTAFPAEKRAEAIEKRIQDLGRDRHFSTKDLRTVETQFGTQINGGNQPIVIVFDDDARLENVSRQVLAQAYLNRIKDSIEQFRHDRQPKILLRHVLYSVLLVALLIGLLFTGFRVLRPIRSMLERRYKERIHGVEIQALQILHARQIWKMLLGVLSFVAVALLLLALYVVFYVILSLFPWTFGVSKNLLNFILAPLNTIGRTVVEDIPNLIFLAIVIIITYYVLRFTRLIFSAIEGGTIKLSSFDREWAKPTYRLVRVLVVGFALVIAFPYIPGSNTQAFKGLSLFLGVIFSLGSTSLIGNLISGYSLTYRRVFRIGDRIQVGDHVGYVEKSTLMVTYLHTVKNEVVAIPNSQIISSDVTNYSALARSSGLILHTTVGIGYETPWRQVEAMLIESARRTPGLLPDPKPFVLQKELGDFAVVYEINVYSDKPHQIERQYAALFRNILDVFNEYGVQIMTPAYVSDPEQAKVVTKENWYASPAKVEDETQLKAASQPSSG